ncbi:MAG: sulfite exporter TauE/SafE family protein [Chloroflexota bacterium]|nr:sulfite exporter TauE/SafE family protein [Chloroflexota bacterium]
MDATLLAAMVIVGISGIIFGMTGFGFALVSVPPLLLLYEPEVVVALTIGASLLTSVVVVLGARRELDGRLVLTMLPGACIGLLLGARILAVVDPTLLKIVAGTLVASYSILLLRGFEPSGMGSGWAASLAGAASGVLATSTGLSGPPIVVLFTARQLARDAFRVTIAAYFIAINLVGILVLLAGGAIGESEVVTSAVLTPAALIGTLVGNRLVRRLTAVGFRTLTLALLLLTGVMGVATAIVALL